MKPIDAEGFEQKFRRNIDPWDYTTSPFEAFKRGVLLHACGCRKFGRGLELACAIGESTRVLAPRCLRLLAVDSSSTALAEAKRRNAGNRRVSFLQARLPRETPRGPFDLIIAAEIVYYLSPGAMDDLLGRLARALAPGGTIVFLHHVRPFDDAAQVPALAQARVRKKMRRSMLLLYSKRHARFDVVAFRKCRR
jgi:SAM-dependent methyltransferase